MSSNLFLKFCKNKIHLTRHIHLVFLKIKIKSLFKIEQGFNKTNVAYFKCHFELILKENKIQIT